MAFLLFIVRFVISKMTKRFHKLAGIHPCEGLKHPQEFQIYTISSFAN